MNIKRAIVAVRAPAHLAERSAGQSVARRAGGGSKQTYLAKNLPGAHKKIARLSTGDFVGYLIVVQAGDLKSHWLNLMLHACDGSASDHRGPSASGWQVRG